MNITLGVSLYKYHIYHSQYTFRMKPSQQPSGSKPVARAVVTRPRKKPVDPTATNAERKSIFPNLLGKTNKSAKNNVTKLAAYPTKTVMAGSGPPVETLVQDDQQSKISSLSDPEGILYQLGQQQQSFEQGKKKGMELNNGFQWSAPSPMTLALQQQQPLPLMEKQKMVAYAVPGPNGHSHIPRQLSNTSFSKNNPPSMNQQLQLVPFSAKAPVEEPKSKMMTFDKVRSLLNRMGPNATPSKANNVAMNGPSSEEEKESRPQQLKSMSAITKRDASPPRTNFMMFPRAALPNKQRVPVDAPDAIPYDQVRPDANGYTLDDDDDADYDDDMDWKGHEANSMVVFDSDQNERTSRGQEEEGSQSSYAMSNPLGNSSQESYLLDDAPSIKHERNKDPLESARERKGASTNPFDDEDKITDLLIPDLFEDFVKKGVPVNDGGYLNLNNPFDVSTEEGGTFESGSVSLPQCASHLLQAANALNSLAKKSTNPFDDDASDVFASKEIASSKDPSGMVVRKDAPAALEEESTSKQHALSPSDPKAIDLTAVSKFKSGIAYTVSKLTIPVIDSPLNPTFAVDIEQISEDEGIPVPAVDSSAMMAALESSLSPRSSRKAPRRRKQIKSPLNSRNKMPGSPLADSSRLTNSPRIAGKKKGVGSLSKNASRNRLAEPLLRESQENKIRGFAEMQPGFPREVDLLTDEPVSDLDQSLRNFPMRQIVADDSIDVSTLGPGFKEDGLEQSSEKYVKLPPLHSQERKKATRDPRELVKVALADSFTEDKTNSTGLESDATVKVAVEVMLNTCNHSPLGQMVVDKMEQPWGSKPYPNDAEKLAKSFMVNDYQTAAGKIASRVLSNTAATKETPRITNQSFKGQHFFEDKLDPVSPGSAAANNGGEFTDENDCAPQSPDPAGRDAASVLNGSPSSVSGEIGPIIVRKTSSDALVNGNGDRYVVAEAMESEKPEAIEVSLSGTLEVQGEAIVVRGNHASGNCLDLEAENRLLQSKRLSKAKVAAAELLRQASEADKKFQYAREMYRKSRHGTKSGTQHSIASSSPRLKLDMAASDDTSDDGFMDKYATPAEMNGIDMDDPASTSISEQHNCGEDLTLVNNILAFGNNFLGLSPTSKLELTQKMETLSPTSKTLLESSINHAKTKETRAETSSAISSSISVIDLTGFQSYDEHDPQSGKGGVWYFEGDHAEAAKASSIIDILNLAKESSPGVADPLKEEGQDALVVVRAKDVEVVSAMNFDVGSEKSNGGEATRPGQYGENCPSFGTLKVHNSGFPFGHTSPLGFPLSPSLSTINETHDRYAVKSQAVVDSSFLYATASRRRAPAPENVLEARRLLKEKPASRESPIDLTASVTDTAPSNFLSSWFRQGSSHSERKSNQNDGHDLLDFLCGHAEKVLCGDTSDVQETPTEQVDVDLLSYDSQTDLVYSQSDDLNEQDNPLDNIYNELGDIYNAVQSSKLQAMGGKTTSSIPENTFLSTANTPALEEVDIDQLYLAEASVERSRNELLSRMENYLAAMGSTEEAQAVTEGMMNNTAGNAVSPQHRSVPYKRRMFAPAPEDHPILSKNVPANIVVHGKVVGWDPSVSVIDGHDITALKVNDTEDKFHGIPVILDNHVHVASAVSPDDRSLAGASNRRVGLHGEFIVGGGDDAVHSADLLVSDEFGCLNGYKRQPTLFVTDSVQVENEDHSVLTCDGLLVVKAHGIQIKDRTDQNPEHATNVHTPDRTEVALSSGLREEQEPGCDRQGHHLNREVDEPREQTSSAASVNQKTQNAASAPGSSCGMLFCVSNSNLNDEAKQQLDAMVNSDDIAPPLSPCGGSFYPRDKPREKRLADEECSQSDDFSSECASQASRPRRFGDVSSTGSTSRDQPSPREETRATRTRARRGDFRTAWSPSTKQSRRRQHNNRIAYVDNEVPKLIQVVAEESLEKESRRDTSTRGRKDIGFLPKHGTASDNESSFVRYFKSQNPYSHSDSYSESSLLLALTRSEVEPVEPFSQSIKSTVEKSRRMATSPSASRKSSRSPSQRKEFTRSPRLQTVLDRLRVRNRQNWNSGDDDRSFQFNASEVERVNADNLFTRYDNIVKQRVVSDDGRMMQVQRKRSPSSKAKDPMFDKAKHMKNVIDISALVDSRRRVTSRDQKGSTSGKTRSRQAKVRRSQSYGSETSITPSQKARDLRKRLDQALKTSAKIRNTQEQLGEELTTFKTRIQLQRDTSPTASRASSLGRSGYSSRSEFGLSRRSLTSPVSRSSRRHSSSPRNRNMYQSLLSRREEEDTFSAACKSSYRSSNSELHPIDLVSSTIRVSSPRARHRSSSIHHSKSPLSKAARSSSNFPGALSADLQNMQIEASSADENEKHRQDELHQVISGNSYNSDDEVKMMHLQSIWQSLRSNK